MYGQKIEHDHAWADVTRKGEIIKSEMCKVCGRRRVNGVVYKWEKQKWMTADTKTGI